MVVKIPDNWVGTFFGEEEANKIVNMTARQFADLLMKNNSRKDKFFLAGAVFDLQWHGLTEKAEELVRVALEKFEAPYDKIFAMVAFGKEKIASDKDEREIKSNFYCLIGEIFEDHEGTILSSSGNVMNCGEFTILAVAGPPRKDLPEFVKIHMEQHEEICLYHRGKVFNKFALSIPVTKDIKQVAEQIIEKYSK